MKFQNIRYMVLNLCYAHESKKWPKIAKGHNSKLEKVSIGHGCPRQNAIQKKVTYVIVTGKHEVIIKVDILFIELYVT